MTKRIPQYPAYIGRAAHIWQANKYPIQVLIQEALTSGAGEITLTIQVPAFAADRKRMSLFCTAELPVSTSFRVAQVDDMNVYEDHPMPTWEAACAWLVANEKSLPRNRRWAIQGIGGPRFSNDVNLFTWKRVPSVWDTPPVRQELPNPPPPPPDLYGLPKLPRFR